MIICSCRVVSERKIADAISGGARSLAEIGLATGAGTCCGGCRPQLLRMLAESNQTRLAVVGAGDPTFGEDVAVSLRCAS